ncbi:hypothetical protein [Aestuariispira insulae]|uniref:Uncharacterized protein n=1 Tax=Aestuariispira insulae TaxID=1461337 RepID=A0A3D9HS37_9PROT|nr:hypothetical protein [Aestuariispira insulae]RED52280.1 hypothetical protein DFP90_102298 [Aestuariispira insulae]
MNLTDQISIAVALAGMAILFLIFRNRESRPGSARRNIVILLAIAVTMAVLFGLGGITGSD